MALSVRTVLPAIIVLAIAGVIAWTERDLAREPDGTTPATPAPPETGAEDEAAWRPQPVQRLVLPRLEPFTFTVEGPQPHRLTTDLRAPVQEILVKEDDAVAAGAVLVRMSARSWERALEKARESGDEAAVAEAEAALEAVRAGLEVRSPVDGVVLSVGARLGDIPLVTKQGPQPLVTLYDWRRTRFTGTVPPEPAFFAEGTAVRIGLADGARTAAVVESIGDPDDDGARAVVLRPIEPPARAPDPGTEAVVLVPAGEREVLVVPGAAVVEKDGRPTVRVVQVTGDLRERTVTLGEMVDGGRVEVIGLTPFESVAVPDGR